MQEVQAFGCSYCGMVSRNKGNVSKHEKNSCRKNPERKACISCVHYEFEGMGYIDDDTWWCYAKEDDLDPNDINKTNDCEQFKYQESK